MTQDRALLRSQLRQRRRQLPAPARIAGAEAMAARVLALPFFPRSGYLAGYWAMDGEIGLHVLQMRLPPGLVYCLPLLDGQQLRFAPWRAGDPLVTNRYGIPEPDVEPSSGLLPQDLALAVMPLVGFDAGGQRLGMGGGYYDRAFAFRRQAGAPPWLVGVGFAVQQTDPLDTADWDVRPDAICTEAATLLPPGAETP
jgi:5-formyltetrahydrofolate cyclo-ligase